MNVVHHSPEKTSPKPLQRQQQNHFGVLNAAAIAMICIIGFLYLCLSNASATRGFALEQLKSEKIAVQKELERVEIALAIPTSLYALTSSEQVQMMAEVDQKSFLVLSAERKVGLAR